MRKREFIDQPGFYSTDTGVAGILDTTGDVVVFDVEHLDEIQVLGNQLVDAGTVVLQVDVSFDGTNYVPTYAANLTEASFAAANNVAKQWFTLSDARGMTIHAKKIRVTANAVAGGGTYSATVTGVQREGYAG